MDNVSCLLESLNKCPHVFDTKQNPLDFIFGVKDLRFDICVCQLYDIENHIIISYFFQTGHCSFHMGHFK